ncbi:hypothetical protein XAPC_1079 [Xanthomonas citri pv. punicae str. LMG 859]|nr:hypothetical protein XAPC_1079 [Xanthomonas citri pv. punicae str. LMG 859]
MNRHRSIVAAPRGLDRSLSDEPPGNAHSASNRLRRPMNKQAQPEAMRPSPGNIALHIKTRTVASRRGGRHRPRR